ncbi:MAG: MMPL family transporter, partial [Nannocystaceae bacterium]
VMMVALGGAFGVHIIAGYQRQAEGSSKERAVATLRELASPVLLSGLTTAVAFFALVVMPQVPMQRFGVAAGIGVLILLCLSLLVMPALLSLLPERLIKPRPERSMPLRGSPRALVLLLIAAVGLGVGFAFLRADPDTSNVFTDSSEPSRANEFFNEHFGGSTYLQIAIEGDLREPAVLRAIRDLEAEIRAIDGVVDVRSVMQPVAILTEAMGGRAGVPETPGRAGSVLTLLSGHPAMAQLMTDDGKGGLVHIKLAPLPGDRQVEISRRVRELVEETRSPDDKLRIVDAGAVAEQRGRDVGEQLALALGAPVDVAALTDLFTKPSPELLKEIAAVRDKALTSEDDSPVDPADVSLEEVAALDPAALIRPRDAALEALLRERLPTLAEKDAAGVGFVAKHLGPWIDEVLEQRVVAQRCAVLGLDASAPAEDPKSCKPVRPLLAELDDREWSVHSVPEGVTAARELEFSVRLTGQPVIGEAFADSVTRSLMESTLVSLVGLAVVLLLARQLVALAPALWTLCVTLGLLAVFGMPISVGTSMIACIALGAGVDFAIHLGARARRIGGDGSGRRAVEEIGAVILISALQLALAFMVLLASEMQPLRDFGAGLAIGLVGAAVGACWLVPLLYRGRSRKTRTDG